MLTENFISQLMTDNLAQAKETISNIISAKAFDALDAKKQELAQNIYVQQEESVEVNEETEQLDELSKDTLTSYSSKAWKQVQNKDTSPEKRAKRMMGMVKSGEKQTKKLIQSKQDSDERRKHSKEVFAKEETEQLDELSRGTLTSYEKKAESDLSAREKKVDPSIYIKQRKLTKAEKENDRKMDNRVRGMMRADDKISKKDADYEKAKEKDEVEMDKKYGRRYRHW